MAWCEIKGKECPIPIIIEQLREGVLTEDDQDLRGLENAKDTELLDRTVSLVEYLGNKGTCRGLDVEENGYEPGQDWVTCSNEFRDEIDDIAQALGLHLVSGPRPNETPVVLK